MGHIKKRQLKDGTQEYVLTVETTLDADEKRHQKHRTVKNVTLREAKAELVKFEHEILTGTFLELDGITLKEFMIQWLENYAEPFLSPTTTNSYKYQCNTYIFDKKAGIGHYSVQKLNTMIVQRFINNIAKKSPVSNEGLSPKTIKNIYMNLVACLDKAVEMDIIRKNPAKNISLPKSKKPEIKVFSEQEIELVLRTLKEEKNDLRLPVNIALALGLHRGEILALKFSDVDYQTGVINIHQNMVKLGNEVSIKEPKTKNSQRQVVAPKCLLEMIKNQEKECKKMRLKMGKDYNKYGYICYKENTGNPWNPDNCSQKFRRFVKRLGVTKVSFHGLRHCFASLCISQGIEILKISKMLGHASASFTYDTYVHLLSEYDVQVAKTMQNVLYPKVI